MRRRYPGGVRRRPGPVALSYVQKLAVRSTSRELLGAASARCAAELAHKHGRGRVPVAAIAAVTHNFDNWLRAALDATVAVPTMADAVDEGDC